MVTMSRIGQGRDQYSVQWLKVNTCSIMGRSNNTSIFRFLMPERIWQNVLTAIIGMLHLWWQDILSHHIECRKMKGMLKLWQQVVRIYHTEHRKMKEMLKLWQQVVLIHHTEYRKMKGMLKLWQQVVLIHHTEDRSKLLILIIEGWQDKLILQR